MNKLSFPVDIVITWVNQNDPKWYKKYRAYKEGTIKKDEFGRFRDYGTFKFVFRSIEKYAPWVNHVYLITDDQIPSWINKNYEKLTIIDHKDIIPKKYLPTFDSNIIEFHIHNIPDLAEHFIYFNDDTFINNYVEPTDFFDKSGVIKDNLILNTLIPGNEPLSVFDHIYVNNLQIINKEFNKKEVLKKNFKKIFNYKNGIWNMASLYFLPLPRFSRFYDPHVPLAFRISTMKKVLIKYPEIKKMFSNRERKDTDFSIWLVRYFELLSGEFIPRSIKFSKNYNLTNIKEYKNAIYNHDPSLICINEGTTISDKEFDMLTKKLNQIFNKVLPEKSKFEL